MSLLKYQSIDGLVDSEINFLFLAANRSETSISELNQLIAQVRDAKLRLGKAQGKQEQTEKFISECQKNYLLIKAKELVSDIEGEIVELSAPLERIERISNLGQSFLAADPSLKEAAAFFHQFSMPPDALKLSSKTLDARLKKTYDRQQQLLKIFSEIYPQAPKENNPLRSLANKVIKKLDGGIKQEYLEKELSRIGEAIVRFEDIRQHACEHINVLKNIEHLAPQVRSFEHSRIEFASSYRKWVALTEKVFHGPMQLDNYDPAYIAFKSLSKEAEALHVKAKQLPDKFVDKKFLEFLDKVATVGEPSRDVFNLPIGIQNLGDLGRDRHNASKIQNALETLDWSSVKHSDAGCFWGLRHALLDIWRYAIGHELDMILQMPREAFLADRESISNKLVRLEALENAIPWSKSLKENLAKAKRLLPKEESPSTPQIREESARFNKPLPADMERLEEAAAPSVKWTFFDYLFYPFIKIGQFFSFLWSSISKCCA